jgi:hypothetical protein
MRFCVCGGVVRTELVQIDALPENVEKILSSDATKQFEAAQYFRRLMAVQYSPPIDQVIHAGIVPRLIELLNDEFADNIKFEAGWALTNIASGTQEQTQFLVENGVIEKLARLLNSESKDVRDQVVWGLANIAGDNAQFRDMVIACNPIAAMRASYDQATNNNAKEIAIWAMTNLARGKPAPAPDTLVQLFPFFIESIQKDSDNRETMGDAVWGLIYILESDVAWAHKLIVSGAVPILVQKQKSADTLDDGMFRLLALISADSVLALADLIEFVCVNLTKANPKVLVHIFSLLQNVVKSAELPRALEAKLPDHLLVFLQQNQNINQVALVVRDAVSSEALIEPFAACIRALANFLDAQSELGEQAERAQLTILHLFAGIAKFDRGVELIRSFDETFGIKLKNLLGSKRDVVAQLARTINKATAK